MTFIYGLASSAEPKNIRYVGKTTNLKSRIQRHLSKSYLREDSHKNRWIRSELRNNNTILISILEEVPKQESWEIYEKKWIQGLKSIGFKLTNSTKGGEGIQLELDIISKRNQTRIANNLIRHQAYIEKFKIRKDGELWTGQRVCRCGKILNYQLSSSGKIIALLKKLDGKRCLDCKGFGRTLSFATRRKIAKSKQNLSQETRMKLSQGRSGKKASEETRTKLRIANAGKRPLAFDRTGSKHSEETKIKIGNASLGKSHSEETRAKIREKWRLFKIKKGVLNE